MTFQLRVPYVVLTNTNDVVLGTMEKMEAHKKGVLHRAISVLLFNKNGEWLLQRRAMNKYHAAGLWSNACCTHPFLDESYLNAAKRRLKEELGIEDNVVLEEAFRFIYQADLENGLQEHELDVVFIGSFSEKLNPNIQEVMDYRFVSLDSLQKEMETNPEIFSPWFRILFDQMESHFKKD